MLGISLSAPSPDRFDRVDAWRGFAIVWMAVFHFSYDLNYFHFIHQNLRGDPVWTWQRTCIVTLFLSCAGVAQAIAMAQGQTWPRFWRRWAQVAGCAILVSLGSWLMFKRTYISFGVLHGIAVMLIITRLTAGAGRWLWLMGLVALALPHLIQDPWFETRATNWVGLVTRKPTAEDYVPIFPWLGVMWWGMAMGQWMLDKHRSWLTGPLPQGFKPLATLGRWSLSFYMLHQPVLIGALMAVKALSST